MATLRDLKEANPIYFSKASLKYYGERLSDMRVLKAREDIIDSTGKKHEQAIVLSKLTTSPSGEKYREHVYFDNDTLQII